MGPRYPGLKPMHLMLAKSNAKLHDCMILHASLLAERACMGEAHMDIYTVSRSVGETDGQTDAQTDGWTDGRSE